MKPYDTLPFTNSLGQEIHPGDSIVVVTGGRGSTINTYRGVYMGCRKSTNWRGEQIQTVVEVNDRAFSYFDKTTGEKSDWHVANAEGRWYDCTRQATLWCNRIFKLA